ncbi:MAG: response regulator [Candidatus Omnitrophota bacterium]|nr:response regulator [Candidatus Omnitrophota bacterium]
MAEKKLRMMIVDDEIEILKMLKDVFELRGWETITTPTGLTVMSTLEKEPIDIILLDIKLPNGSGLTVLKNIKKKYPKLPVIMFTGFGYEDNMVNEAMHLGAAGYVSKNVPIQELIEVINNTLIKQ